jgi:hypothetical protein
MGLSGMRGRVLDRSGLGRIQLDKTHALGYFWIVNYNLHSNGIWQIWRIQFFLTVKGVLLMGNSANIIVREMSLAFQDDPELLLYVPDVGHFYGKNSALDIILRAYNSKRLLEDADFINENQLEFFLNVRVRGYHWGAYSSIIATSGLRCFPVGKRAYDEYAAKGWFYEMEYRYIIEINSRGLDENQDVIWDITLGNLGRKASFDQITRTVKQWMKYNQTTIALESMLSYDGETCFDYDQEVVEPAIKDSIHFREVDLETLKDVYRNVAPCPCDDCLTRATCLRVTVDSRDIKSRSIREKCELKTKYEKEVRHYLLKMPLQDVQLQELLNVAFSWFSGFPGP